MIVIQPGTIICSNKIIIITSGAGCGIISSAFVLEDDIMPPSIDLVICQGTYEVNVAEEVMHLIIILLFHTREEALVTSVLIILLLDNLSSCTYEKI
jgi:hypothetical protein